MTNLRTEVSFGNCHDLPNERGSVRGGHEPQRFSKVAAPNHSSEPSCKAKS